MKIGVVFPHTEYGNDPAAIKAYAQAVEKMGYWYVYLRDPAAVRSSVEKMRGYLQEAGRSPADFGLEGRIPYGTGNPTDWRAAIDEWTALGATHLSVNTMRQGFATPQAHMDALAAFATELELP